MFSWGFSILVELEFGHVGFVEREKPEKCWRKTHRARREPKQT